MPKQSIAQKSVYWMKIISLGLILGLGIQFAEAWTSPTIAPPGGNVSGPITTSIVNQVKMGSLGLAGSLLVLGSTDVWDLKAHSVNVTNNLVAGGMVQVGNTIASCSAIIAGSIRWTGTAFEGCDGSAWQPFGGTGGSGSCPKNPDGSYPFTISSNTPSYNLYSQASLCGGINFLLPQKFILTINSGVDVGNLSLVGPFASGTTVKLVNKGRIFGAGGTGGTSGSPGLVGGHAITLSTGTVVVSIENNAGFIYGGGGGGGGAGYPAGGAGAGAPVRSPEGDLLPPGPSGHAGTLFTGGAGSGYFAGGTPGAGGNIATPGTTGSVISYLCIGGAGGAAGNAVKLNGSTVTWLSGNDSTHVKGLVN